MKLDSAEKYDDKLEFSRVQSLPLVGLGCSQQWVWLISIANTKATILALVPFDSWSSQACISAVFDSIVTAKVNKSPDLAVSNSVLMMTTTTDRQSNYFTSCACTWGNEEYQELDRHNYNVVIIAYSYSLN